MHIGQQSAGYRCGRFHDCTNLVIRRKATEISTRILHIQNRSVNFTSEIFHHMVDYPNHKDICYALPDDKENKIKLENDRSCLPGKHSPAKNAMSRTSGGPIISK